VLTAALALVALPGLAGSRVPSPIEPVPAGAFQSISVPANGSRSIAIGPLDAAFDSAATLEKGAPVLEPGSVVDPAATARRTVDQPAPKGGTIRKPARYTLTGFATFYDNGTTAMRLPRGTHVVICGNGGCIDRVVTDYGPQKKTRVVDMYRPDFFRICGCGWFAGTTKVTVYVY
jgi:hypothetical protein